MYKRNSMNKTHESYDNFDWIKYTKYYKDLKNISNKKNAFDHWLKYGKKENRIFFKLGHDSDKNSNTDFEKEYDNFNWKIYIENYPDLKEIKSKKEAWIHWISHGKKEKRVLYSLHEKEMQDYLKLKVKEEEISLNNENENLILKPFYSNYGLHYFGWEGVMKHLLDNIQRNNELKQYKFKEKIFLDEWIEKLFIWGNKFKNTEFLQEIEENNYKWISFLHNPPFNNYYNLDNMEKEELEKNVLFNENLLNKNVFETIDTKYPKIKENIKYLYTLSNSHKKYIYNSYPEYRNKLVSVYHPIDLKTEPNKIFNFNEFKESKSKQIFHIGWWLRNFKTFIDICFPSGFQKNILVKKDFEREWNYISSDFDLTNIQVIKHLNNEEYEKIFRNACIFCDMEDAVANNVVLECIKFNTPIIVKKIDSIIEYLGEDYPLYFSTPEDLSRIEFSTTEEFLSMISSAHDYLLNKNKKDLELHAFNKKILYDLHKLATNNNQYSLTWFCFIENENQIQLIPSFIEQFKNQIFLEKIILKFIIHEKVDFNQEVSEIIEKNENIECIFIKEENSCYYECLNVCLDNTSTEYLTIVNIQDVFLPEFSSKHIDYLDNNPNCDIAFSNFTIKGFMNEENENEYEEINNKYEKGEQIFIDEFDNKPVPTTSFVWRKKIHSIVYYFESFTIEKKDELEPYFHVFLKKCLHSHLNICCISDEIFSQKL